MKPNIKFIHKANEGNEGTNKCDVSTSETRPRHNTSAMNVLVLDYVQIFLRCVGHLKQS